MFKNFNAKILIFFIFIYKLNSSIINETFPYYKLRNLNFLSNNKKRNNNKKNLLIGAIVNYSWNKVRNFFISLIKVGIKNCDFVMFVGNMPQTTIEKIRECGFTTYDIPKKYLDSKIIIPNYRFKIYEDYLIENKDKYNMVFTADVRDTIFQKDIFQLYNNYSHKPFFAAFQEDEYIKNDDANKRCIKFFCGDKALEVAGEGRIICSGTILATVDKFIEFCHIVWEKIEETKGYDYLGE